MARRALISVSDKTGVVEVAQRLQKLGFEIVGKRPRYYEKPREDALILRKEWSL